MTLKELLAEKARFEKQMADLQQTIEPKMELLRLNCYEIQTQIDEMLAGRLHDLRKLQGKEFGVINMIFEGFKVSETVPKKVEWDQEKLAPLFFKILESGDKPSDYMRMKLEVPEKLYGDFPPQIKSIFDEARTVKAGRPTLKIEEVESKGETCLT